jgi:hypothetical protein
MNNFDINKEADSYLSSQSDLSQITFGSFEEYLQAANRYKYLNGTKEQRIGVRQALLAENQAEAELLRRQLEELTCELQFREACASRITADINMIQAE